jgi:hypothetical protein
MRLAWDVHYTQNQLWATDAKGEAIVTGREVEIREVRSQACVLTTRDLRSWLKRDAWQLRAHNLRVVGVECAKQRLVLLSKQRLLDSLLHVARFIF